MRSTATGDPDGRQCRWSLVDALRNSVHRWRSPRPGRRPRGGLPQGCGWPESMALVEDVHQHFGRELRRIRGVGSPTQSGAAPDLVAMVAPVRPVGGSEVTPVMRSSWNRRVPADRMARGPCERPWTSPFPC